MKGTELWAQYQHYTRDITEHGRKLGFAGAAICWFFKSQNFTFPASIYIALLLFVAYFIFDILQNLIGALFIRFFTESEEKKQWIKEKKIDGDFHKPRWVDIPAFIFFLLKCFFLIIGFTAIAFELLLRLV